MYFRKKAGEYVYYYSNKSKGKIVHFIECSQLKKIKSENIKTFSDIGEVRRNEYRVCNYCSPIVKKLRQEKDKTEKFCMENGLLYYVHKGNLHVRTYRSEWIIRVSDNKFGMELHHKNSYEKEHSNSLHGYHKQDYKSDSILDFLKYINEHECYRTHNPLYMEVKKEPAKKGTKRWKKQKKALESKERKKQIYNVINMIDMLSDKNRS